MREYLVNKALYSMVVAAMLVLGGCSSSGGSSSSGNETPSSSASGSVVDGYIANGHLYADLDGSKDENPGDINTTTDDQGNFSFGETTIAHGTYLYVTGGTDLATNTPFTGELSAYFFGEATVVSPLSTLIVSLMQNEGLSYDEAKTRAAAMMGLSEAQVIADPMSDPDVFIASQRVVAAATTLGGDFSTAVDALASEDMNITAAAGALVPEADPADALAVDTYIIDLHSQIPSDAIADQLMAYQQMIASVVSDPSHIPNASDSANVADALACLTFDKIKYNNTAENNITTNLQLDACDATNLDATITWDSNDTTLIDAMGVIASNVFVGGDVDMTATITAGTDSSIKVFNLSIPRLDNHPPVAIADANTTAEDTPISFNILANDTDADGDALSLVAVSDGVAFNADGTVTYTPIADFNGVFSFNYTVRDSWNAETNGTVSITVTPVNDAPVLDAIGTKMLDEDFALTTYEINATDVDSGSLTYSVTAVEPAIVNASFVSGNQLELTSIANLFGDTNITVMVSDGDKNDTKTFTLTVVPVDDTPVINFTTPTPVNLTETMADRVVRVDMNITDIDTPLSSVSVDNVSSNSGTIAVQGFGVDYVDVLLPAYANGDANITVTANDGEDISTASFMVHVTAVDSLATITPTMIDVNITAGTQNFSLNVAPVDETYTLSIVSSGDGNIAFFQVSGYTLEVTPNTQGTTSIVVRATNDSNNTLESDTTITVHVYDPDNIAPVAYDGNISVVADEIINGALSASDANGDLLGFTIVKPPVHGSIVRREPWGTYAYAAMDGYIGQDSFTFTASDGALDSNIATVTIDVTLSSNTDNNNGDLTEKPITLDTFNGYAAQTAYEMPMYSVWENGSVGLSELEPERLVIHNSPAEIDVLNMETNGTQHIPYTLDTDSATLLIDFDANGSIDFKAKYVGTATKTELENELNLTLPDGSAGYKLATLQLEPEYDVWDQPVYSDDNSTYSSLATFMTDKSYDSNTPNYHSMWIDGYEFKFAEGSDLADTNGTIVRTAHYDDGSGDTEIITNTNAGTWKLVTVDAQDYILVTPTVYGLNKVQLYTVDSDTLVHSGEYRPANRASLEYKFDETTMYHIANSIMNREVTMPDMVLTGGLGEFISFNTLEDVPLIKDTNMTAIWADDGGNGYEINTHGLYFDTNGSLYMRDTQDGDSNMTYSLSGNIVTINGAGIEGKVVEKITSPAEVSALTGVPQGNLPTSPVLYRFAHIDPNADLDLWSDTVYGLDTITTYSNFADFQTAFMSGEVVLDYTPNGGIGYAGGIAGVGGTLAEYDSSLNIITPNAGTWKVVNFDGQDIIVFDATVRRYGDHNAVAYDGSSLMVHGRYSPPDSGSVELRYNDETTAAIISYLQDQNTTYSNPIPYEKEIRIRRDIEAVPFTNEKMYTADLDVNSTTCESNVTQTYVWFNGNSSSGTFVISNVAGTGPYVSTDGKIVVVPDNDAGNDLYLKVNRELNATELMTMTSLYLPISARGYEVSYMNKDDDSASGEILFDLSTVQFLESYLNNNPMANTGCTLPQP